ncbi:hypothetical protein [Microbacterium sp. B35-30]|uniref:hypothetical protein n=1 Tax=Microbacterium sp. B35-30 TaxID=1962642 RepID=UPI0013D66C0C|nr:hypothetical protein [Microbacterium sp. B35-30]KAF2419633.1 hypothetical protein B2K11_04105 [Microbacterium sp. B35-30]
MTAWVNVALLAIAVNAVLIQTIVPEDSPLRNVVRVGVLAITVAALYLRRAIVPVWMVILALLSFSLLLIAGNTDQLSIVFVLLLIPALWSIPELALGKAAVRAALLSFILVFVFLATGVTQNEVLVSSTALVMDRERWTFGTDGVPFFMNIAYSAAAVLIYFAFRWNTRSRWVVAAGALAAMFYYYTQTNGRGGLVALLIFCGLAIVMPLAIRSKIVRVLLAIQPAIYLAISLWIASQRYVLSLNETLSYRPSLYGAFLESVQPLDLLWSETVKQTSTVSTVDNSYLHLLVGGGIVIFVAFSVIFAASMMNMSSRGMTLELAFVTASMAYAVSESILLRVENIFIVYTWYLILRYAMKQPCGSTDRVPA